MGTIDELVLKRYIPVIGSNSVKGGFSACCDCCMSRSRLGEHIYIRSVFKVGALIYKPFYSIFAKPVAELLKLIVFSLFHHNPDNKLRFIGRKIGSLT